MNRIALPQKISFKKGENDNQEIVVIESFYPGYGVTIGNSLRRILLSSLEGCAVVGVKMENVGHEFTTIPKIKEDVLDIILNLKKIRIKSLEDFDEPIKLRLEVSGDKVKTVKASNIEKSNKVEIINKDLVIANITDSSGKLAFDIYVDKGRGYRAIDHSDKKNKIVGYVDIDSVFSPVLSVGVNIENVRVGKMTNWDRLLLDIGTDGSISPKEAFETSVGILIEQFQSLVVKK